MTEITAKLNEILSIISTDIQNEYEEDFNNLSKEARDFITNDYINNHWDKIDEMVSTAVFE